MKLFLIFLFIQPIPSLFAQKQTLSFSTPAIWPTVTPKGVSNNGKYLTYTISSPANPTCWFVQATDNSWKEAIYGITEAFFTKDSRWFIFKNSGDSLEIVDLLKGQQRFIEKVVSFKIQENGSGQWIAYMLKIFGSGIGDLRNFEQYLLGKGILRV